MSAIKHYVLIDPFNSTTSGVTTYTNSVEKFLIKQGVGVEIISRFSNEKLPEFRRRIAKEISKKYNLGLLVEAPESLHTTSEVDGNVPIHIRLHGSRQFGNWLQGQAIDRIELAAEQHEIERARLVSAPSWAAVEASRNLFQYPVQVRCYPNPLPILEENSVEKDIDLLFLGRWQPLKGIVFFEAVVRLLPGYRIAVACTERPPGLLGGVTHIPIRTPADRSCALARSRIIIIPSIFETASMVGLEALVAGRQVIAWGHLGLTEYADEPFLYRVKPWCIDGLVSAFEKAISQVPENAFNICTNRIQAGFSDALGRLLSKGNLDISTMPFPVLTTDWNDIFNGITNQKMKTNKYYSFQRKLRKLMRNPSAFWKDSSVYRLFNKNVSHNQSLVLLATRPIDIEASPELLPVATSGDLSEDNRGIPLSTFLGFLGHEGKISLKNAVDRPKGWVTTLVYNKAGTEEALSLFAELNKHRDFAPLREESLTHILTEVNPQEPIISILNRIDLKNKERIALIDNIVFINVSANVLQAMRCCGTANRTILVLTESAGADLSLIAADTDAVICLSSHPAATLEWRRKNVIENLEQLPRMLRKVLQELGPKSPDMLLPLIGCTAFDPSLMAFDARRHQGIIRLAPGTVPRVTSLHEYITHLAVNVREMLILDSVYMRYRSLCEKVEAGGSPAALIEACLQDGVLFDVH